VSGVVGPEVDHTMMQGRALGGQSLTSSFTSSFTPPLGGEPLRKNAPFPYHRKVQAARYGERSILKALSY
jgi:hypothetical protein